MNHFEITLMISGLVAICLLSRYLDAKYQWQLTAWFTGKSINPFEKQTTHLTSNSAATDSEIALLKERIATLEAIVTEPAFELNQKLKTLSENN